MILRTTYPNYSWWYRLVFQYKQDWHKLIIHINQSSRILYVHIILDNSDNSEWLSCNVQKSTSYDSLCMQSNIHSCMVSKT